MEKPQPKNINLPTDVRPIYADEVNVSSGYKANVEEKDGKKIANKIGKIDLMFLDRVSNSVISRVVIDPLTANALGTLLTDHANKIINQITNTNVPEEITNQIKEKQKAKISTAEHHGYIG